jgi:beta-glucan synthesis-associated protein SKN1
MQYLIFNLGMARELCCDNVEFYLMMSAKASFQTQDFQHMQFPAKMYIDYIRVYQRSGVSNGIGCDPPNRPTANYITKYIILSFLLPTGSNTPLN